MAGSELRVGDEMVVVSVDSRYDSLRENLLLLNSCRLALRRNLIDEGFKFC